MKKFGRLYPNSGYGARFGSWLMSDDRSPYNSFGNGSAMRVAPCAWFAASLDEAEDLAARSAVVTHNHPEGIKGAQATAAAIYLARNEGPIEKIGNYIRRQGGHEARQRKEKIKNYIEQKYGYNLSRTLDEIRPVYQFNETCQETVPEAIIAYLESGSFTDAIRNAISLGGDSDTLAAITGSIAEAEYCIPSDVTTEAFHHLDDTLSAVINAWVDSGKSIGAAANSSMWQTSEFSTPHSIKAGFRFSEVNAARLRFGLLPEQMEDKWFACFENGKLSCYRSWTGFKIYEAEVHRRDKFYEITELIVERDTERYEGTDDEDINLFQFLVGRGMLGLNIEPPIESDNENAFLKGWSGFGRMIL